MPFSTVITEVILPGKVIAEMVEFSRRFSLIEPPNPVGGYLQTDDSIECDSSNKILKINGIPLSMEEKYNVGINHGMLDGLDNIQPLID